MPSGTIDDDDADKPHAGIPVSTNASTYVPSSCRVVIACAILGIPGCVPLSGITGSGIGLTGKLVTAAKPFPGGRRVTSSGMDPRLIAECDSPGSRVRPDQRSVQNG